MVIHHLGKDSDIYRVLVENAFEGIGVVDSEGHILFENRATERLWGYDRSARIGRNLFAFVHPDDAGRVRASFEEIHGTANENAFVTCRMRTEDSGFRVVEIVFRAVVVEDGQRLCMLHVRPLTDRPPADETSNVGRLNPMTRRTVALANDFENLFTTMSLHVNAILKTKGFGPFSLSVHAIKRAAEIGAALTRQFLTIQYMSSTIHEVIDVNEMLRSLAAILDPPLTQGARLHTAFHAERPRIFAVRARLEYVLMNLIATMREVMPADTVLTVETRDASIVSDRSPETPELQYVQIDVKDTIGRIPHATRSLIVETQTRALGPGEELWLVGRAIMYDVVDAMGGFIRLETEGEAIAFRIFLPVHVE